MTDSTWLEIKLFSTDGGKFHKPAGPIHQSQAWCPTRTACGLTVKPVNYFEKLTDAYRYTGGRLSAHLCKHCCRYTV